MTGGRLKRVKEHVTGETFCFTYGDGVSDLNIGNLISFHRSHGKKATITAVQPPGRFGALEMSGTSVDGFHEKPAGDGAWINGGYFVLEPAVIDLIENDKISWEEYPLVQLAEKDNLKAYQHKGFWQPMDTLRDKNFLEDLWTSGKAPWKVW